MQQGYCLQGNQPVLSCIFIVLQTESFLQNLWSLLQKSSGELDMRSGHATLSPHPMSIISETTRNYIHLNSPNFWRILCLPVADILPKQIAHCLLTIRNLTGQFSTELYIHLISNLLLQRSLNATRGIIASHQFNFFCFLLPYCF